MAVYKQKEELHEELKVAKIVAKTLLVTLAIVTFVMVLGWVGRADNLMETQASGELQVLQN